VLSKRLRRVTILRRDARLRCLNLALQGGGAHGAFTWGVLDSLLEIEDLRIDGISGASAGAINAVAIAAGLALDGRAGARNKLAEVWGSIADTVPALLAPLRVLPADVVLGVATRVVSPYQFNPFDLDPLRDVLARTIDFKRLRRAPHVQLHIAATDVADGRPRIFVTREISLEVVLASACLPHLRRAVRIGRRHYWDGGFSANPPLLPLVFERRAADTLIVLLDPLHDPELPTSAPAIARQVGRLTFNAPLRREVELIRQWRGLAAEGITLGGHRRRRLRHHRFHLIDGGEHTRSLEPASRLYPERRTLEALRDSGRTAARAWFERNFEALGQRATIDLAELFS
jgi:NTE family protein